MHRCLRLAYRGEGQTSPNPMVGAVIVKNGRLIAAGYHKRYGGHHAEINAIDTVRNKSLLHGSTLYVNLEPCCHYGNTPPCVNEIVKYRFGRVVVGIKDPNVLVNGKSIRILRKHGIRCDVGILKEHANTVNERYFHYMASGMPFVALKAAQTHDGYIASDTGAPKWISNTKSRTHVHLLRSRYDAVLVGAGTVKIDDPRLTVRKIRGRHPVRIVVDGLLTSPVASKIFDNAASTIVYTTTSSAQKKKNKVMMLEKKNVVVVSMRSKNDRVNIRHVLHDLARHKITSVLVEGGQEMYAEFLNRRLANKIYLYTAPMNYRSGISLFGKVKTEFSATIRKMTVFGNDTCQELYL